MLPYVGKYFVHCFHVNFSGVTVKKRELGDFNVNVESPNFGSPSKTANELWISVCQLFVYLISQVNLGPIIFMVWSFGLSPCSSFSSSFSSMVTTFVQAVFT